MTMYVCICNNVTQTDIKKAVENGARTLECLARRLGVSTCCGQCQFYAFACLESALEVVEQTSPSGDNSAQLVA